VREEARKAETVFSTYGVEDVERTRQTWAKNGGEAITMAPAGGQGLFADGDLGRVGGHGRQSGDESRLRGIPGSSKEISVGRRSAAQASARSVIVEHFCRGSLRERGPVRACRPLDFCCRGMSEEKMCPFKRNTLWRLLKTPFVIPEAAKQLSKSTTPSRTDAEIQWLQNPAFGRSPEPLQTFFQQPLAVGMTAISVRDAKGRRHLVVALIWGTPVVGAQCALSNSEQQPYADERDLRHIRYQREGDEIDHKERQDANIERAQFRSPAPIGRRRCSFRTADGKVRSPG